MVTNISNDAFTILFLSIFRKIEAGVDLLLFFVKFRMNYTFFISNTIASNTRLKIAKNQANFKQHLEAELDIWNLFALIIHIISQDQLDIF